ncbi:hypothetical protein [Lapillicoccus jejuensis]|uniref:Beta-galactosidase-like protein n=1 Tax=Lapillicoccus jejuensis TaxID=402171 RepID=A0A542DV37_9MICO|nr:hypothetical protein [Lapillicoccus jejuensis]TQJ06961.1 hypothetical protein FB458_0004 [Lapillicoccus jejuensis]TQJ11087.1 hypothetical protein FB458_4237 [Lapillicoccus jejuensis]
MPILSPRPRRAAVLAVLTALAVLGLAACSGSSTPPTRTSSSSSSPSSSATAAPGSGKPWVVGVMDRKGPPDASELTYDGKPLVQGFVIQVLWKDVQPTGPDSFDTSKIDQQLAFAKAHDLAVRMRVYAGYNSPAWVLQSAGSVTWQGTANDAGPTSYPVPVFWGSRFQQLFQQFDAKLAAKYDGDPQLRELVPGMCITNFAEPFQRQFSEKANVASASGKGYSDATDQACLKNTVSMFAKDWRTTNMAMAFNPYQSLTKQGSNDKSEASAQASVQVPEQIAKYCVSELGPRCVLGNNSMKGNTRGKAYDALYTMLQGLHQPLYIQTASNAKIQDWQAALTNSVEVGAISIELPDGYQKWDKATLQSYDAKLQANADKLSTT